MTTRSPGRLCTVRAEVLARHGDAIAHHELDGRHLRLHVPGLFPGEVAEVRVEHLSRHEARGQAAVERLLEPAPGRRAAPCPHHGTCTGCSLMELRTADQREAKLQSLRTLMEMPVDRIVGDDHDGLGYRWSSKRVAHRGPRGLVLGSYRRGTHEVADMTGCLVDHPDIARAADELASVANACEVTAYDEATGEGDLRYAWFRTDGHGHVLATLVTAEARSRAAELLPSRLPTCAGVAWAVQPSDGNDMRGITVRPLRGLQSLKIEMASRATHVGPLGFLQPNPEIAAIAYRDLVGVPAGGRVRGRRALDLYAGAGITTALLGESFTTVVPCESFPESAARLGVAPRLVEDFLAEALRLRWEVDLAVANPPRGGLGATVCDQLNRLAVPRLHIMSCSPRSARDDLERLTGERGAYRLYAARAYDTLPQTPHVEVVLWLIGRGGERS
jgi:23S rRNA (uracil1939-C5)-methyltransferase